MDDLNVVSKRAVWSLVRRQYEDNLIMGINERASSEAPLAPPLGPHGPVLVVSSTQDPASQNIAQNLITEHSFLRGIEDGALTYRKDGVRLVSIDKPCIFAEQGDIVADGSSIIFASKHVSEIGKPALTVHATGNLIDKAEYGGRPGEVSYVDPPIIRHLLQGLRNGVSQTRLEIPVTMEATHHGPTSLPRPVCFVEIGSSPREWMDPVLGRIAANAIMSAVTGERGQEPLAVGFGGTHYSAKHTRICMDGGYQIGHLVPRHAIESRPSDSVLRDTFRKTVSVCETALVDWKGLGSMQRAKLVTSLRDWGCEVVRC